MALGDAFYETSMFDVTKPTSLDRLEKLVGNTKWLRDQATEEYGVIGGILRSGSGYVDYKTKVRLSQAQSIHLSDGRKIPLTAPIEADITVSGAGGLDTGTEAASTWYQPYVIAKNDGTYVNGQWTAPPTTSLIFRTMHQYAVDQSQASLISVQALNDAAARTYLAQSFTPATTGKMPFVELYLARLGGSTPAGDVYVEIQTNSAGSPSGTVVATSVKLDASIMNSNNGYLIFPFEVMPTLTAATSYWIVLKSTYATGAAYVHWYYSDASGYGGAGKRWDGAAWQVDSANRDYAHRTYVMVDATPSLTLPSGYTAYTKAGPPVHNGSGSDFRPFAAIGRQVIVGNPTGSVTPAGIYLGTTGASTNVLPIDVSSVLPPELVTVEVYASAAAGVFAEVYPVPDGSVYGVAVDNKPYSPRWGMGGSSYVPFGNIDYVSAPLATVWAALQRLYIGGGAQDIRFHAMSWTWRV